MGTSTCRNQTRILQIGLNRVICMVSKSSRGIKFSLVIDNFSILNGKGHFFFVLISRQQAYN